MQCFCLTLPPRSNNVRIFPLRLPLVLEYRTNLLNVINTKTKSYLLPVNFSTKENDVNKFKYSKLWRPLVSSVLKFEITENLKGLHGGGRTR